MHIKAATSLVDRVLRMTPLCLPNGGGIQGITPSTHPHGRGKKRGEVVIMSQQGGRREGISRGWVTNGVSESERETPAASMMTTTTYNTIEEEEKKSFTLLHPIRSLFSTVCMNSSRTIQQSVTRWVVQYDPIQCIVRLYFILQS